MLTIERILAQLELFSGHEYGARAFYPTPLRGVRLRNYGDAVPQIDCCSFVEGLLIPAAGIQWSRKQHKRAMIRRHWLTKKIGEPFSPINVLIEAGLAEQVSSIEPPPPWSVVQFWRKARPWVSGHTLKVVKHDAATDKVFTLEANKSRRMYLDGVGTRGIGHYRDHGLLTPGWQNMPDVPTWAELCQTYPYRSVARLLLA